MRPSRFLPALGLVFGLATVADAAPSVLNRSRHRRFVEGTVVAVHHDRRAPSAGTITIQRRRPYHRNRSRRAVAAVGANRRRGGGQTFPVNRQTRFERTPGGRTSFSAVRRGETVLIEPGSGRQRVARLVDIFQGRPHHAQARRRAARRAIVHTTPRHRSAYRRVTRPARVTHPRTVKPKPHPTHTASKQPPHKPATHPRPASKPPAHKPTHPKHPEHKKPQPKKSQPKPAHHPRPKSKPPAHKKGK